MSNNRPFLDLADQYYAVAKDLKRGAEQQLEIAEVLNQHADRLCETHMRTHSSQPNESISEHTEK